MQSGTTAPVGAVNLRVVRSQPSVWPSRQLSLREIVRYANPDPMEAREVNEWREENRSKLIREATRFSIARAVARKAGLPYLWSQLWLRVNEAATGRTLDYGLAGIKVVTTAGVNAIVDAFQNTVELENFKYHGIGTGSTAEAVGDTALVTELTTQYSTDNTRATGTTAEGASANIYQTVATNSVDASVGIQEHGIFTSATSGAGTLLDRTVFSVINLGSGDSLESTYELTVTAGG